MRTYTHPKRNLRVDVPDELKIVFYHLHLVGKKNKKSLPVVTVALAVHSSGDVLGRGITVCSPEDFSCFCKREGRIRAAARAVRAYNKATTGKAFHHPRAKAMLQEVFDTGMYQGFKWNHYRNHAIKHEYMPKLTLGEKALLEEKGFHAA